MIFHAVFIDYDPDLRSAVGDVFLQRGQSYLSLDSLRLRPSAQVNVHHVPGQSLKKNPGLCISAFIIKLFNGICCFVHPPCLADGHAGL